ncbi:MAG: hypothetical protein HY770_03350 [Chitinivibrionia bacterium]|nr:hypothetical protein [Chitinivibrionia bacterium]
MEEKDAGPEEKSIGEVNSGLFCFDKHSLFETLKDVGSENAQREYYLTDVIGILQRRKQPVAAFCVDDPMEVAGVNTAAELERVADYLERKPR